MKNLVIVDTIGDLSLLHPDFVSQFDFVDKWSAHQPFVLEGSTSQHPHGGMVLEKALCPLWDRTDIHVHFVRVFDQNGKAIVQSLFENWLMNTLESIRSTGPTWVNNSWGAYAGSSAPGRDSRRQASLWRSLISRGNLYVGWAAGNSGDYNVDEDRDYPQSLLTDVSDKIGAANKNGRPSKYSGDSRTSPPLGVYWATNVALFNPNTGKSDKGSGTSFACPKHVGLMCARNIITREDVNTFAARAVRPARIPAELIPHPKWGEGWLEDEYQKELEGCPFLQSRIKESAELELCLAMAKTEWFDFMQVSKHNYEDVGLTDE